MWVQLLSQQLIEVRGKPTTFHPGDWVEVSKQTADRWVLSGQAQTAERNGLTFDDKMGIVARGKTASLPGALAGKIKVVNGQSVHFEKTLFWDGQINPQPGLLAVGFNLLEKWQVAAPLWSYTDLASQAGNENDRNRAQTVLRDLRVLLYDYRLVFVRRCADGLAFVEQWQKERGNYHDERLAFLVALYQCKPIVCALPVTWVKK